MGVVYMNKIMNVESPRVGLLNIGAEETKGKRGGGRRHEALSRARCPEFAGNCEGGDLLAGAFDVVVCDGFSGNVCLKTIEGTSKTLFRYLKGTFLVAENQARRRAVEARSLGVEGEGEP